MKLRLKGVDNEGTGGVKNNVTKKRSGRGGNTIDDIVTIAARKKSSRGGKNTDQDNNEDDNSTSKTKPKQPKRGAQQTSIVSAAAVVQTSKISLLGQLSSLSCIKDYILSRGDSTVLSDCDIIDKILSISNTGYDEIGEFRNNIWADIKTNQASKEQRELKWKVVFLLEAALSVVLARSIRDHEQVKMTSHISTLKHADSEKYFYFWQYVDSNYNFKPREVDGSPSLSPSPLTEHICNMLHKEGGEDEPLTKKNEETVADGLEASPYQRYYLSELRKRYNGIGFKISRDHELEGSPFSHTLTCNRAFQYDQLGCTTKDIRKKCSVGLCNHKQGAKGNSNDAKFSCFQCKTLWNFSDFSICEGTACMELHKHICTYKQCAFSFFKVVNK